MTERPEKIVDFLSLIAVELQRYDYGDYQHSHEVFKNIFDIDQQHITPDGDKYWDTKYQEVNILFAKVKHKIIPNYQGLNVLKDILYPSMNSLVGDI